MEKVESDKEKESVLDSRLVSVKNVSGSTAGACSGDFHVYRQQRRKEVERVEGMEREALMKEEKEKRLKIIDDLNISEDSKTLKRSKKRQRRKLHKKNKKHLVSTPNSAKSDDGEKT